jgi:xylulose-5-phosphate/fructose-6-phosphate phosphoketolase
LLIGYGHKPYFVEGDDPSAMHQQMASTMARCILEIRSIQHTPVQLAMPRAPAGP